VIWFGLLIVDNRNYLWSSRTQRKCTGRRVEASTIYKERLKGWVCGKSLRKLNGNGAIGAESGVIPFLPIRKGHADTLTTIDRLTRRKCKNFF
jgi:hypothetical protein